MFKIISDLNLCERVTREYAGTLGTTATSGTWVTIDADGKFASIDTTASGLAFPIWSEGNRDGSPGFTPDVEATGKLTVLYGKFRAVTDQVSDTDYAGLNVGDPVVIKSGVISAASAGEPVVAYVSAKLPSVTHLGTTFTNCVEFYSV